MPSKSTVKSSVIVPFTRRFPPELRAAFLDLLEPSDLLGYSLACKAFNAEANRVRWRDYTLWFEPRGSSLDDACAPLLRDPTRAGCIKSFSILVAHPPRPKYKKGQRAAHLDPWTSSWSMFSAALATVTSATTFNLGESSSARAAPLRILPEPILLQFLLCIQVWMASFTTAPSPPLSPVEARSSSPRSTPELRAGRGESGVAGLTTFYTRLDLARIIPLLSVCPSLTHVALNCGWDLPSSSSQLPPGSLPNLHYFEGDAHSIHALVPHHSPPSAPYRVESESTEDGRPHLHTLAVYVAWPSRTFGDLLRRFTGLVKLRVLQPPCDTSSMGDRLKELGPLPRIHHLEYAYDPSTTSYTSTRTQKGATIQTGSFDSDSDSDDDSDCLPTGAQRGEALGGHNITDVLAPIVGVFPGLHTCLLECPAHPDDTGFPLLLSEGPGVLAALATEGAFEFLERFEWNMGPGRRWRSGAGKLSGRESGWKGEGDRVVNFRRIDEGEKWEAEVWWDLPS